MSQIREPFLLLFMLLFFVLSLAGCGSSNSQSDFDSVSGEHPAGWLPGGHKAEAKAHMETCAECHGSDYQGGIAKTACTQCHLGNQNSIHPTQWGTFAYALHGSYAKTNGTSDCANADCHGENLDGVFNSGPSCTSCHIGGPTLKHPAGWETNAALHKDYVALNGKASCSNTVCHGENLGGVFNSGPSCTSCHIGGIDSKHPLEWNADITLHENYVRLNGITSCSNSACHGADLKGVPNSGPSCWVCH